MKLLLLLLVSPILGILGFKLSQKTKIPLMLLFIIIGVIFGVSGIFNIFGAEAIQPAISTYSSLISVSVIFIMAGFSLDFELIKANQKAAIKLGVVPVYVGLVVVTIVSYFLANALGLTNMGNASETFNIYGMLLFTFMIVLSAPVLVVPAALRLKQTEKPIGVTMIAGEIIDNYSGLPVAFVALAIAGMLQKGQALSVSKLLLTVVAIIVGIAIMAALGLFISKAINKALLKTSFMQDLIMNKQLIACVIYSVLCIGIGKLIGLIPVIGAGLNSFVLVYIIMFGAGLGSSMSKEQKASMTPSWNKFVLLVALPIMFLGLGGRTDLSILFSFKVLAFVVIVHIVNRGLKMFTIKKLLKSEGFNDEEQTIGARLAYFDGASPVNMSIALTPMLVGIGQGDIAVLAAAYGIITFAVTIPLGEKLLSKFYRQA